MSAVTRTISGIHVYKNTTKEHELDSILKQNIFKAGVSSNNGVCKDTFTYT